jgi:hypothetical protein
MWILYLIIVLVVGSFLVVGESLWAIINMF